MQKVQSSLPVSVGNFFLIGFKEVWHYTFYLFSDGIVDQYGGANRKKYKSLNSKKLLLSIQKESMKKQGQIVENTFETWKGEIEQIDDVSVIGVKIE